VLLASGETKAAEHEVEARGHGRPSPADRAKEARLERDEKTRTAIKAGPLISPLLRIESSSRRDRRRMAVLGLIGGPTVCVQSTLVLFAAFDQTGTGVPIRGC
jgi:hypothetical protein